MLRSRLRSIADSYYPRRLIAQPTGLLGAYSAWMRRLSRSISARLAANATAAAIDRLVHHATILEFNVPSYRT
jgi:hypothetical protein